MSKLAVWTTGNDNNKSDNNNNNNNNNNNDDVLNFESWLTNNIGVSGDCYQKLRCYGFNSISMLKACTDSDIEDISHDAQLRVVDKLKLKVAIKKINECDNNKHLIIDMEERNIMIGIDNKIKEFEEIINDIDRNKINDIILGSKKCEKEINDTFETLYNSLKKRQEILLNKLYEITNDKKNELILKKKNINQYLEKSIQIKQECHKLLNKATEIEQLNDRKQKIGQKAHKVIRIKCDYDNIQKERKEIVVFQSYLNSLLKIHNKFGDVYSVKYTNSDRWDMNNKGDNILINNKICICNIDNEYQSVFGSSIAMNGSHHWRLKIIKTTYHMLWNTMIGILQINKDKNNESLPKNTYFTENGHSYAFIGNCSALEPNININAKNVNHDENDDDDQPKYGQILKNGSIVDVILDCNQHTLKYHIDGTDFGIAYQHIPKGKYCLAVTMTQKNDRIQLISYCGQQFV